MVQKYLGDESLSGDWGVKSLVNDNILNRGTIVQTVRTRFTVAQVNSGATLLAAKAGFKYRMVDVIGIAVGGAVGATTTVDVLGTQATSGVKLAAFAQANMTRSTVLRPGVTGTAVLADGASFAACDANTAITVGKTDASITTATHIDIQFSYVLEAA
jgi:hypothetical protein